MSKQPFAPGVIEHHHRSIAQRHVRHAARWLVRVLVLLVLGAVAAAALSMAGGALTCRAVHESAAQTV